MSASLENNDGNSILKRPGVSAAAGALLGLGLGIVLGRATVSVPNESAARLADRPAEAAPLTLAPKAREPEPEPEKTNEYRVQLGRDTPRGKSGRGFERERWGTRQVARLAEKEAVLEFDIEKTSSNYMLTAIIGLEGGKRATLDAKWDGQALGSWGLEPGWGMYGSPVPSALLEKEHHELALSHALPDGVKVSADSVAVYPVSDVAQFGMGPEAVGHLIDGFANIAGRRVWSYGPRSTIGVALDPAQKPYRLIVRGSALAALAPLTVSSKVNGTDVGAATFTAKVTEATWAVPAKALRSGINRIELTYSKTARPTDLDPTSKDNRPLAVRFANVELIPN
jgi:hypothetical protein